MMLKQRMPMSCRTHSRPTGLLAASLQFAAAQGRERLVEYPISA